MSRYLRRFTKSPLETIDYDISFAAWLALRGDTIATFTQTLATGISLGATSPAPVAVNGVVRLFIEGGTSGMAYEVTARITTTGGRVKTGKILVRVR